MNRLIKFSKSIFILFFFFYILIPYCWGSSEDKFIDAEEAAKITKKLNNHENYELSAKTITFTEEANIVWGTDSTFIIKSKDGISFKKGSFIASHGKGGTVLYPNCSGRSHKATVKFEESTKPYIDFSQSTGSVCLYYNPAEAGDVHKYLNLQDWSQFISVKHPHKFMSFMFINTVEDLEGINKNPSSNYVLGDDISIPLEDTKASNPCIATQFRGRLYSNERRLFSQLLPQEGSEGKDTKDTEVSNYSIVAQFSGRLYQFLSKPDPRSEVDIPLKQVTCKTCFGDNIYLRFENIWEQFILYSLPPLHREIFEAAKTDSLKYFEKIQDISELPAVLFAVNSKERTLLHVTVRRGSKKIFDFIKGMIYENKNVQWISLLEKKDFKSITAIDLAVKHERLDFFEELRALYTLFEREIPSPKHFIALAEERAKQAAKWTSYLSHSLQYPIHLDGNRDYFPDPQHALHEEINRQKKVEKEFFLEFSSDSKAASIFKDFNEANKNKELLIASYFLDCLDHISSRERIILFYKLAAELNKKQILEVSSPIQFTFAGEYYEFCQVSSSNSPRYIYSEALKEFQNGMADQVKDILDRISGKIFATSLSNSRQSGKPVEASDLLSNKVKRVTKSMQEQARQDAEVLNKLSLVLDFIITNQLISNQQSVHFVSKRIVPMSYGFSRIFDLLSAREEKPKALLLRWLALYQAESPYINPAPAQAKNQGGTLNKVTKPRGTFSKGTARILGRSKSSRRTSIKNLPVLQDVELPSVKKEKEGNDESILSQINELYNQFERKKHPTIYSDGLVIVTEKGMWQELVRNFSNNESISQEFESINLSDNEEKEKEN